MFWSSGEYLYPAVSRSFKPVQRQTSLLLSCEKFMFEEIELVKWKLKHISLLGLNLDLDLNLLLHYFASNLVIEVRK